MTRIAFPTSRRPQRRGLSSRARGGVSNGMLVAAALVAALALQVAGPRLQGRLASLVGVQGIAPASPMPMPMPMPASGAGCGGGAGAPASHPCKLANAGGAGRAPVI